MLIHYVASEPECFWRSDLGRWVLVWGVALAVLVALGVLWVASGLPDWLGALEGWAYVVEHSTTGELKP